MKLDVGRHTQRWTNLERRVKTVPDSPERGFELALYSAVSNDSAACQDAVKWGKAHPREYRQVSLIADWCRAQTSPEDHTALLAAVPVFDAASPFRSARDILFHDIATARASRAQTEDLWARFLPAIQHDPRSCVSEMLALFEFIDAAHSAFRVDLRQQDAPLFSNLPAIFLLSLPPAQVESPEWKQRMGGLMMVNVDPNLQPSSFVQGWAMEDPKLVSDGPGVAYEFLLANPYLPGLGYYNMDLYIYDQPSALLLARKSWDQESCWMTIVPGGPKLSHCPSDLLETTQQFGKLSLVPMQHDCIDVSAKAGSVVILSHLPPGQALHWQSGDDKFTTQADASGLALVSASVEGTVCQGNAKHQKNGKGESR
jgi:hypothetical protein